MKPTRSITHFRNCYVAILAVIAITGCGDAQVRATQSAALYPSGVDDDPMKDRLPVSSYHDGTVREADPVGRSFKSILEAHKDGKKDALRVKVDPARNRLWVLDLGSVYIYDTAQEKLMQRVALPDWSVAQSHFTCLPDMALDQSGAAFISSNVQPTLWRIDANRFTVKQHEIRLTEDLDKDFGFSGLAFTADDGALFAVSAVMGSLWRIDIDTEMAYKVQLSSPVRGGCALAVSYARKDGAHPPAPVLFVSGGPWGGLHEVARVALSPNFKRGEVARVFAAGSAAVPTSMELK